MTSTIQRTDEDLINKSLLDSIDADNHPEQSVAAPQPIPGALDAGPLSFTFSPRHSSPPPMGHLSYPQDPYATQEDIKRTYGRPPYNPYLMNGSVVPQQPVIAPPFRDPTMQKYPTPTALDVFGPQEHPRQYELREPLREFGPIALSKPPPPHHGVYHGGVATHHPHGVNGTHHVHREEEISTIFVVGFPDDMQEREFQNMFTFAKGFEAASLKIPHKDQHNSSHNQANGFAPTTYPALQDPFNVVTPTNVSLDANAPTWPVQDDVVPHPPAAPRKQIIGFAKFRSRAEALEARDFLQGRKVDVERGAMLKAEMAKKNLHTKRGPGPSGLPLSMVAPGSMVASDTLASLAGLPGGAAAMPTQTSGEAMRDRERELGALGAMGFIGPTSQRTRDRGDSFDKDHDPSGATSRGRYGTSDSESETENNHYLRMQNQAAFDAFHGVQMQVPQPARSSAMPGRSIMSPTESFTSLSPSNEPPGFQLSSNGSISSSAWGSFAGSNAGSSRNSSPQTDIANFTALSLRSNSPQSELSQTASSRNTGYFPPTESLNGPQSAHPATALGAPAPPQDEATLTRHQIQPILTDTPISDSPPDFSSPPNRINTSDQNPPINTLYVGNLPTSPPPPGYSPSYLEDNLRSLFQQCIGYRKLCFRQKENGPMCFVEFDDVPHASKALNDLYGNQLGGLVKSGIRLSYSKNPLGVRSGNSQSRHGTFQSTPWSAGPSTNGVPEPKFTNSMYPAQETGVTRGMEQTPIVRAHRDSVASELSANAAHFNFPPLSSRYFSPTAPPYGPQTAPSKLTSFSRPASVFSPFASTDTILTPIAREHTMHPLSPSPSIESTRAG